MRRFAFAGAMLVGTMCGAGVFTGTPPAGWIENFGWNNTEASGATVDGVYRLDVAKLVGGPAQFLRVISSLIPGRGYRLEFDVRNHSTGDAVFMVRQTGKPYREITEIRIEPDLDWQRRTCEFVAPFDAPKDMALLLQLDGKGVSEFRTFSLTLLPPDAKIADGRPRLRTPPKDAPNLFRNDTFALGLPSGWNVSRDHNDGRVGVSAEAGPSGVPALVLEGQDFAVDSEPFVSDGEREHTLSFAARGTGSWRCEVFSRHRGGLATQTFAPTDGWTRVALRFTPNGGDRVCAFHLSGHGKLQFDALRVAAGPDATFVPSGTCTVALAPVGDDERAAARVQFVDEAPDFRWRVDGAAKGQAAVAFKVTDLEGCSRTWTQPVGATSGTTAFLGTAAAWPKTLRGQFRLEAWAERDGARVSPVAELVLTRLARPKHLDEDAPHSPFGVHVNPYGPHLALAKAAGFNHVRCHDAAVWLTGWYFLETARDTWSWEAADKGIAAMRAHHLTILGQLGTAPLWRSYGSKVDRGRTWVNYFDRYFQPLSHAEFQDYVRKVAARYRGQVDEWFVWNEPWNQEWWAVDYDKSNEWHGYKTSKDAPGDFARLCRSARVALREANPQARLLGLNTTSDAPQGVNWTAGVVAEGPLDYCDAVDFHYYTVKRLGFPEDVTPACLDHAVGALRDANGRLPFPVYMTEGNAFSNGTGSGAPYALAGFYKQTVPWEPEDWREYADRTVRYYVSNLSRGVSRIYLYSMHCYGNLTQSPGILVMLTGDGYPHPALAAVSALAGFIEDTRYVRTETIRKDLYAHVFVGKGVQVRVVCGARLAERGTVPLAAGEKAYDLFGNPTKPDYCGQVVYLVK